MDNPCTMKHNKAPGICVNSRNCPENTKLNEQGIESTTCNNIRGQHIVCCPEEISSKEKDRKSVVSEILILFLIRF